MKKIILTCVFSFLTTLMIVNAQDNLEYGDEVLDGESCHQKYGGKWYLCPGSAKEDAKIILDAIEAECGIGSLKINFISNSAVCGSTGGSQR